MHVLFEHVLSQPQLTRSFMEMSLRDPQVAELRRAFEQLATQKLATLIQMISTKEAVPDPEATAYVLYGAAMQAAYGLAVHLVPAAIDRERAQQKPLQPRAIRQGLGFDIVVKVSQGARAHEYMSLAT